MNLNWDKYGIDVSKVRGGKTTCPKCSHTRKRKSDMCLSVDLKSGLFNCHNAGCEFRGTAVEYAPKKEYVKPPSRLETLSAKSLDFFENKRKISNNTLLRFKISECREWMPQYNREVGCICFNYFRRDQLVNIKFRGPDKAFKMVSNAELIFYNLDAIKDEKSCIIVEGEIDCLTLHECGIYNSVSVPNGASKGSAKLEYLDNCYEYFEGMEKIIIATDGDEAGMSLRDELARRLGKERCYLVAYPDGLKDTNDILMAQGKDAVIKLINEAFQWPVEGIKRASDMFQVTNEWYQSGYPKGADSHIPGFKDLLTFAPGQLTTVTGIPGHGKDEFLNWVMTSLSVSEQWSWGICGFEESPEETVTKLVEKFKGKAFGVRRNPNHRITQDEFESGMDLVQQYFYFINLDEIDTDIDTLLAKGEELVRRHGIKGYYLNPWNWIEHNRPSFMSETEYVSLALSKIIRFAKRFKVHVFLLAHTTKMQKDKTTGKYDVPTLYNISGSANFFNKTHNGLTVFRDFASNSVDVYVQKVKQSWLGKTGFSSYHFDTDTRQYSYTGGGDAAIETPKELGAGNWKPVELPESDLFENPSLPYADN